MKYDFMDSKNCCGMSSYFNNKKISQNAIGLR